MPPVTVVPSVVVSARRTTMMSLPAMRLALVSSEAQLVGTVGVAVKLDAG